jgi:hypothetical protein
MHTVQYLYSLFRSKGLQRFLRFFFILFFISVFLTGTPPSAVCAVPIGLMDYITPYDVCETMPALREYLTAKLPEGGTISEVIHFH